MKCGYCGEKMRRTAGYPQWKKLEDHLRVKHPEHYPYQSALRKESPAGRRW